MNIMNLLSSNDFNIKFWYKIQFILNIVWVELCHKFKFQSRNIRLFFHSTWDESIQLIHHLYSVKKWHQSFNWIYRNLNIYCPCFPFQLSWICIKVVLVTFPKAKLMNIWTPPTTAVVTAKKNLSHHFII